MILQKTSLTRSMKGKAMSRVFEFPISRPAAAELEKALNDKVFEFEGRVTVAEVVGILELVKMHVVETQEEE